MEDKIIDLKKEGKTWQEIADTLDITLDKARGIARSSDRYNEIRGVNANGYTDIDEKTYEDDGSISSYIRTQVKKKKTFSKSELLKLHGLDPNEFKIRTITSNEWTTPIVGESFYNYQSKIVAEPLTHEIDWGAIGERLADRVTPKEPKKAHNIDDERYLVIPIYDPHFGLNALADYDDSLGKIFNQLENDYKKVLIISGGDILHTDNYQSTTASGTQLETIDLNQAWEDAFDFFDLIIDKALNNAETVELLYVPGNHDETIGQTVFKALTRLYQREDRLTIDDEQEAFKAVLLGHNFIGATHGVKRNKKDYPMLFATQFSQLWGADGVITRETFTGHLHHELTSDMNGLLIRQMPTRNKTDKWHRDNGFVGSHKRFQLVEYSEYETEFIRYV